MSLTRLYNNLSDSYKLPPIQQFVSDMQDEQNLKKLHSNLSGDYQMPDFDTFKLDMNGNPPTQPPVNPPAQPQSQTSADGSVVDTRTPTVALPTDNLVQDNPVANNTLPPRPATKYVPQNLSNMENGEMPAQTGVGRFLQNIFDRQRSNEYGADEYGNPQTIRTVKTPNWTKTVVDTTTQQRIKPHQLSIPIPALAPTLAGLAGTTLMNRAGRSDLNVLPTVAGLAGTAALMGKVKDWGMPFNWNSKNAWLNYINGAAEIGTGVPVNVPTPINIPGHYKPVHTYDVNKVPFVAPTYNKSPRFL